jgi:hypothetical protein
MNIARRQGYKQGRYEHSQLIFCAKIILELDPWHVGTNIVWVKFYNPQLVFLRVGDSTNVPIAY